MNDYSCDVPSLIKQYLPPILRQQPQLSWYEALLAPMASMHTDFVAFVEAKRYEMDFTGQVVSLERLLNDQFDDTLRRIYISDGNRAEVFIFKGDQPLGEENFFFKGAPSSGSEIFVFKGVSNSLHDFVVNVPASLTYDSVKMNALINKYRQAGKRYIISTF